MVGCSRFGEADPLVLALTFATSGASALFFGAVPAEPLQRFLLAALGAALGVGHALAPGATSPRFARYSRFQAFAQFLHQSRRLSGRLRSRWNASRGRVLPQIRQALVAVTPPPPPPVPWSSVPGRLCR